jgi:hypothetical protein
MRRGGGGDGREERAVVCSSDEEYRAMTVQARRHVWMGAIPLHLRLHSSEVTSLPAPPPFLVHPKLCLSVSLSGSLSVCLSEVLGLLAWSSDHCLLVFHYLDELLLLCNEYFFGINFSWGHKQIYLSALTHGWHGKKEKRI